MSCTHNWTVKFLGTDQEEPFEARPVQMSLKKSRSEYDFCRAKFPTEVGDMLEPETRFKDGSLHERSVVEVCYNGTSVQRLMMKPDWVNYGSRFTHIEFHDLQKSFAKGLIDIHRGSIKLKQIYEEVIDRSDNLIEDYKFTIPENNVRRVFGAAGYFEHPFKDPAQIDTINGVNAFNAINFDQISPEKALERLNEDFSLKTWVNSDGVLIIGIPEAHGILHVAAPDDSRVWRYHDPNVTHPKDPIKSVVVEGGWMDAPGPDVDPSDWFDQGGTGDYLPTGVAVRQDVNYGQQVKIKNTTTKRDGLSDLAVRHLKRRMKTANSGTVKILPDKSGEEVSSLLSPVPGDIIHLVPDDDFYDKPVSATTGNVHHPPDVENPCGSITNNEKYLITEVEHNVTMGGEWQLFVDVVLYTDVPIDSTLVFFDPESEEWVSEDDVFDNGLIGNQLPVEDI
jgi:hypothetical protein